MNDAAARAKAELSYRFRKQRAAAGLNLAALHTSTTVLYQAIAHGLCYLCQKRGLSQGEFSERLRSDKSLPQASLSMSDTMRSQLQTRLGLVRCTEAERRKINRALDTIYYFCEPLQTEDLCAMLIPWLVKHAPQVGVPSDVMVTRIENLDALTRFHGTPCRHIPEHQYGL
jgi:hypothetical protein